MTEFPPRPALTERPRIAERRPLRVTVQYRKGLAKGALDVIDISTHGAKFSAAMPMRAGETFWIKLPALASLEARVAWRDGFTVGCEFLAPLHPSVVDSLLHQA